MIPQIYYVQFIKLEKEYALLRKEYYEMFTEIENLTNSLNDDSAKQIKTSSLYNIFNF